MTCGSGAVNLEGIVAACAAAQEARRPLPLCIEDFRGAQVDVSEGGGAAHSCVTVGQAAECSQAL